jgi:restriction endonuclease S subunit
MTNGGTKVGLTLDDVRSLTVLLPPWQEQKRIVEHIDSITARLASAVQSHKTEIETCFASSAIGW